MREAQAQIRPEIAIAPAHFIFATASSTSGPGDVMHAKTYIFIFIYIIVISHGIGWGLARMRGTWLRGRAVSCLLRRSRQADRRTVQCF